MVGQVADFIFVEMVVRVEYFGFVVEMIIKLERYDFEVVAVDFVVECVGKDNSDMTEDIDNIEKISHKEFALLKPKVEIEIEVEAKVAAKDSNFVGTEDTFDC